VAPFFTRQNSLVGKGTEIINSKLFYSAVNKLVDAKYALGNTAKGFDCVNSLIHVYRSCGINFPKQFKHYTEQNYADLWKEGKARDDFEEFLHSLGQEINPNYKAPGDLLLFEAKEIRVLPAVYVGNGKMLLVLKEGLKILPFKFFKKILRSVRRLG
jgi:cell wall-associated NlpC family hydrolase